MDKKKEKRAYTRPANGYLFERLAREDPERLARLARSGGHATIAKYGRDAHLAKARAAKAEIHVARREAEALRIAEEHKGCLTRGPWTASEVLLHDWRCCPLKVPQMTDHPVTKAGGAR